MERLSKLTLIDLALTEKDFEWAQSITNIHNDVKVEKIAETELSVSAQIDKELDRMETFFQEHKKLTPEELQLVLKDLETLQRLIETNGCTPEQDERAKQIWLPILLGIIF